MDADRFRESALAQFGAIEGAHMGHADFRANGRIFASLEADDERGMVKLSPEQQAGFVKAEPAVYAPATGAWGRQGCTMVTLARAQEASVGRALKLAWKLALEQKPGKSRT